MTSYQASQAMRRLETGIREQKGIKAMAQASGDPLAVRECNARIKRYKDKYAEISNITGIAQDKKRMILTGADKIKGSSTPKTVKSVDNSAKSGIINDVKLHQGRQDKHIIGTNNYVPGKSYLTISNDEIKQIIKDKSGTGIRVGNKEQIIADKIIGVNVNKKHSYKTLTDKATIHYSNNGTHLVPTHAQLRTKSIPELKKYCKKMAMQYYDTDSFTKYIGKLTAEEKERRIDLLLESKQSKTSLIKDIKSMEKKILRERGEIK